MTFQLAEEVSAGRLSPSRDALLGAAVTIAARWPGQPARRFRATGHAIERFRERARPDLDFNDAQWEIRALAHAAPFTRVPPTWTGLTHPRPRSGYLLIGDEAAFAVTDGVIRTVLTAQLAASRPLPRLPQSAQPTGVCDQAPAWPRRNYLALEGSGLMRCSTVLDGRVVHGVGRSSYSALLALHLKIAEAATPA